VGIAKQSHLRPLELSDGEKQRVAIARALGKAPQLMFANEPTSALDGENGQVVIDLLKRTAHDHGAMVLAVTHDPRLLHTQIVAFNLKTVRSIKIFDRQTKHQFNH
jgi:putative ABC transport system ATP-binding protein